MKSLKRIQTMAKVFKILSTVAFVGCIVGAVFSVIGCAVTPLIANSETLQKYLTDSGAAFEWKSYLATCICSALACGAWIYLGYENKEFYKAELEAGNPFNKKIVGYIRKLAIECVVAACIASVIGGIICAIFHVEVKNFSVGGIGLGLVYLLVSLILDYGADLNEGKKKTENVDDKKLN